MEFIKSFGFYVFRRPLLPLEELFSFLSDSTNQNEFEEGIRNIFRRSDLQEAIYLASPVLYSGLQNWLKDKELPDKKIPNALFKYLLRSGMRCTPYGMFAGCVSPGRFDKATSVSMNCEAPYTNHLHLDTKCIKKIVDFVNVQPSIRKQCQYYPNDTLYQAGDKYRYIFQQFENDVPHHTICSVDASIYLNAVLKKSENGAAIHQLANELTRHDVTFQQAKDFVDLLIEEQILISELQVPVVGPECLKALVDQLSLFNGVSDLIDKLSGLWQLINSQQSGMNKYLEIKDFLRKNFNTTGHKNLVRADITFNTKVNSIGKHVEATLSKAFEKLLVIHQQSYNPSLENFKKRFYERYEEQEVPLLVALDSEIGIGYEDQLAGGKGYLPLLDGLNLDLHHKERKIEWNDWKSFILRKYSHALFHHDQEIILTDKDLDFLKEDNGKKLNMPGTFAAFGNLLAESEQALDRGDFLFNLHSISGPSCGNLLTRFCHGDEDLNEKIKNCLKLEESHYPDAIVAEIVHLPDEISGNILKRPSFRKFEIPFLSRSSVDEDFQIPLNDLMISVRYGKEIILRSRKHNKRVLPRLTNAHNFGRGTSIYRFLCDLQFEGQEINIRWHWSFLEKELFLPRVRYKNIILSRATWTWSIEDYPELRKENIDLYVFFSRIRNALRMPRYVVIAEYDKELFIDLEHPKCLSLLKEEFIKKQVITIKEYLQMPEKCFLKDSSGRYANEIIIPFKRTDPTPDPGLFQVYGGSVKRFFSIGSEWLYFKIYAGEKTIDSLLKLEIRNIVRELINKRLIDQWFFVRYADPENHLRIRFHGEPSRRFCHEVTQLMHTHLDQHIQSGLISRIRTDTYKREIERYGDSTMELSEKIFYYDSEAVVELLNLLNGDVSEDDRWLLALYGTDQLFNDFSYTFKEKMKLIEFLRQNYFDEFKVNKNERIVLDLQYRKHSEEIARAFDETFDLNAIHHEGKKILQKRSGSNRRVIKKIAFNSSDSLNNLLVSYIHMFLNRLFVSKPRMHELVIYHYLYKYYKSCLAKGKLKSEVKNYA